MEKNFPNFQTALTWKEKINEAIDREKADYFSLNEALRKIKIVDEWKYSKGILYTPIHFFNELMEENPGKSLKKKYTTPMEASRKGIESAGFINGKLEVTIDSEAEKSENVRLTTDCINHLEESTLIKRVHHYSFTKNKDKNPELISLTKIGFIESNEELMVTLSVRGDFIFKFFLYDAGLIKTIHSFGKNYSTAIKYEVIYDAAGTVEKIITAGRPGASDIVVWYK